VSFRFQFRRGTAAERDAANPVLAAGEPAVVLDSGQPAELVLGDGVTAMADLRRAVWGDDTRLALADTAVQPAVAAATFAPKAGQSLPSLPLTGPVLASATVLPIDTLDGWLYGAEGTQLRRSSDHGATWLPVQDLGGVHAILGIRAIGGGEVIVIRDQSAGLYRSSGWSASPSTATFTQVLVPSTGARFMQWGVDTNPLTGKVIAAEYAGAYTPGSKVKLSTDNGASFSTIWDKATDPLVTDPANTHLHLGAIDPWEDDRLYISWHNISPAGARGLFYSDDDGATWVAVTRDYQPTTCTPTDRGLVFGSDELENGVYVIDRADPTRTYRRAWEWREDTNALAGFAHRSTRDPATGIVYVGFVAYPTFPLGMVAASDGVTASQVWRSTAPAVTTSDGVRNVVVDGTKILASVSSTVAATETYQVLTATIPPRGSRVASSDDPGAALGGTVAASYSTAVGVGAEAAGPSGSVAVGAGAVAGAPSAPSTAIGWNASVTANNSIAIGDSATVAHSGSLAIGGTAATGGTDSTLVGHGTTGAINSVVVGKAGVGANNSVVVGKSANIIATKTTGVAVGYQASAGSLATAVGSNAGATLDNATAVGNASVASGALSSVLGNAATSSHSRSVALGSSTATTSADQVAIGPRHVELMRIAADAGPPAASGARLYTKDNGSGKTQLCVRFTTGAVVVIATEP